MYILPYETEPHLSMLYLFAYLFDYIYQFTQTRVHFLLTMSLIFGGLVLVMLQFKVYQDTLFPLSLIPLCLFSLSPPLCVFLSFSICLSLTPSPLLSPNYCY